MPLVGVPFFTHSGSRMGAFLKSQSLKKKQRNLKDKYIQIIDKFAIQDNNKK